MRCRDCLATNIEPHELTEGDVWEHAESGGFSRPSNAAIDRIGSSVCPECLSSSIVENDEADFDDLDID